MWMSTRLPILLLLMGIMTSGGGVNLEVHRDPCHQQHSCPSDRHTYLCGDRGRCEQCPEHQFYQARQPRLA